MKKSPQLLRLLDLPVFETSNELARLMHIDPSLLKKLIKANHIFYRKYNIRKKNGSFREIRQPNRKMKAVQAWILRNILDKLTPSTFATAFIPQKRLFENVIPHEQNRYFACFDLEDFFPSISFLRVWKIFKTIGYSPTASHFLARLTTYENGLPQGGVSSPALSNLVSFKLDRRIAAFTSLRNISFTRYADDITLSSNNPKVLNKVIPIIRKIIQDEKFKLNEDKFRLLGPRVRCVITGLVKDSIQPKFGIGRNKKRKMRAIMHQVIVKKKPDPIYPNETSLKGWLNFLKGNDPVSFSQMAKYFKKIGGA